MRERVTGAIGVVWGGGIWVSYIWVSYIWVSYIWVSYMADGAPSVTASAYAAGRGMALVLGALLLLTGLYYLLRVQE